MTKLLAFLFVFGPFLFGSACAEIIEKDKLHEKYKYRVGCTPNSDNSRAYKSPIEKFDMSSSGLSSLLSANFSANVVTLIPFDSEEDQMLGVLLYNGKGIQIRPPGTCSLCEYRDLPLWFINSTEWDCRLHKHKS